MIRMRGASVVVAAGVVMTLVTGACTGDDPTLSGASPNGDDAGSPEGASSAEASAPSLTIDAGGAFFIQTSTAAMLTVTAKRGGGLTGPITLAIDALPAGLTATANTVTIPAGASSAAFALTALATQVTGHATIKATVGTVTATTDFDVTVRGKPGELDVLFGTAGRFALTNLDSPTATATGDHLYVLGRRGATCAVVLFTDKGVLDTSYGESGAATFTRDATCSKVLALPDGKVLVFGVTQNVDPQRSFIARVLPHPVSGSSLDATFGTGGIVELADVDSVDSALVDSKGRIVFTGDTSTARVIRRLLPSGAPDATFIPSAMVASSFPRMVTLGASDSIFTAITVNSTYVVTRLDATGKQDSTFGTAGIATPIVYTPTEYEAPFVTALVADANDHLVAGTQQFTNGETSSWAFAQRLVAGKVDPTWATTGNAIISPTGLGFLSIDFTAVQSDGAILAVLRGENDTQTPNTHWLQLNRFTPAGIADNGFGAAGLARLDEPNVQSLIPFGMSVDVQHIAVAYSTGPTGSKVVRFWR